MNETYVTLTGRVGSEVQIYDAGGQALASFRVANTPRRRRKDGEWGDGTTTWFQVKAWRRLAGHVKESLRVGDPVVITGRLESDVWVREDGTSSTQLVVTATSVGHDLALGTSLYTKPARRDDEPSGGDPWDPAAVPVPGVDMQTGEILDEVTPSGDTGDAGEAAGEAA